MGVFFKKISKFALKKKISELEPSDYVSLVLPTLYARFTQNNKMAAPVMLLGGLADEFLVKDDKNLNKHLLTRTLIYKHFLYDPWLNELVKIYPNYKLVIMGCSFATSFLTAKFLLDDCLNFRVSLGMPLQSLVKLIQILNYRSHADINQLSKKQFFDDDFKNNVAKIKSDLVCLANNKFLVNFAKNIILTFVNVYVDKKLMEVMGEYAQNSFSFIVLSKYKEKMLESKGYKELLVESVKMLSILFFKQIFYSTKSQLFDYLEQDSRFFLNYKCSEILFEKNNIDKILNKNKHYGKVLIDNFEDDIHILSRKVEGVRSFVETYFYLINAIKLIESNFLKIPSLLVVNKIFGQQFSNFISKEINKLLLKQGEIKGKYSRLKASVIENYDKQINIDNQHSGKIFLRNKLDSIINKDQGIGFRLQPLILKNNIFEALEACAKDAVLSFYFSIILFNDKEFEINKMYMITHYNDMLWNFFMQNKDAQFQNLETHQSLNRISDFYKIITEPKSNAIIKYTNSESIVLKNYSLHLDDKLLISIDNLELRSGVYLLSGKSGCGKSSLISDLLHGVSGALRSSGEIHLPNNIKMALINKEIYKVPDLTLFETICYPRNLKEIPVNEREELKQFIVSLLKQLEIDQFCNDSFADRGIIASLETENFSLSAGQNQKMAIIQGILQNIYVPKEIIFMDEPWCNLDKRSIELCKEVIVQYFPNKTIIVVDHGESENLAEFYKARIHVADGSVSYQENKNYLAFKNDLAKIGESNFGPNIDEI